MATPKGILVILIDPEGKVWGKGADFDTFKGGDSNLKTAQERRANIALAKDFFHNTCSPVVGDILANDFQGSQIIRRILEKGWRLDTTEIGYEEN
jgi:hypothetical protein